MSQLPVTALNARIPVSRLPTGLEFVWQANVPQAYNQNSPDHHAPHDPSANQSQLEGHTLEEARTANSSRRQHLTGQATSTTSGGAYSHQPSSVPERHRSEAPNLVQQFNLTKWIDENIPETNPEFLPEAAYLFDALMAEVNGSSTYEQ